MWLCKDTHVTEIEDVFEHLDLKEENQNSWGIKLKRNVIFVKIVAGYDNWKKVR